MHIFKKISKQKGFTIVELLLVVTIIGILATITGLFYVGVSDRAKMNGFKFSAQDILKGIKFQKTLDGSFNPLDINETNIQTKLNIQATNFDQVSVYDLSGNDYVYIVGKANYSDLVACGTSYDINVYRTDDASCALGGSSYVVAKVIDVTPGSFGGGDGSTCTVAMTIDSIEDLVALSNNVNGGNTYSGKCIKLAVDLDFNQNKSYVDPMSTTFGDINGNLIIEGLKTELTTSGGFRPIGNNSNNFRGKFFGELHNIYDLYINRSATDYVGLFGYNNGQITAFNLINASVRGNNYTGLVAGQADNRVDDISASGNVIGNNYVALGVGTSGDTQITGLIVDGNITGVGRVGGIVGYMSAYATIRGIYKSGAIIATGGNVNRTIGSDYYGYGTRGTYVASSVTINGSTVSCADTMSDQGSSVSSPSNVLGNINSAELILDTYIGGDNDANGYYWDYDDNGNVIHKTISDYPITFTLSGLGTDAAPYLINSYDDLRQASSKNDVVYKLNADIDMTNKRFYMLGSHANPMTGTFDGNLNTISNITINAPGGGFLGFVGLNRGKLHGLSLTNFTLSGGSRIGLIAGQTDANIIDDSASGNVTGSDYVSLGVGWVGNVQISSLIVDGNITGASNVGGIAGYMSDSTNIRGVYKSGSIVATGGNVNRSIGGTYYGYGVRATYAASSITINGATVNSTSPSNNHGAAINGIADLLNNVNSAEMVLDTYIGGDNNNDGYYWDYDTGGNLVHRRVVDYPLTFNLSGAGTNVNPYLINTYDDLRQATLKTNMVYKLNADIDLSGKRFYMLGSSYNPFTGTFDGNLKTISNMTIDAPRGGYMGFIGFNRGALYGLTLTNALVNGGDNIGLLAGQTDTNIIDDSASGNITGSSYVSLGVGWVGNVLVSSLIVDGNITGVSNVGGLAGYMSDSTTIRGVYKSGSIVATGGNVNRAIGGTYYDYGTRATYVASSVTINGSTVNCTSPSNNHGAAINNISDLMNNINSAEMVLDTYIGGDNNSDGYYWDYDAGGGLVHRKTSEYPLEFNLAGAGNIGNPYIINTYDDLRQASLKTNMAYKLNADIDLSGKRFYMLGSFYSPFTGTFNGNLKTISNMTIDAPRGAYMGFIGLNRGSIIGLTLANALVNGGNNVGILAGQTDTVISDDNINGSVNGSSNIGLVVGFAGNTTVGSIIFSGNISGASNVGGMVGYMSDSTTVRGVYKSGSVSGTGSGVGRIIGGTYYGYGNRNSSALSTITVNGSTVSSPDASSTNGLDASAADLQNQVTYTNRGFNFTDETKEYIWYMDTGVAKIRKGTLF